MEYLKLFKAVTGLFFFVQTVAAQQKWENADSLYGPLPAGTHVYRSTSLLDGKPNIAYYFSAELKKNGYSFEADTTYKRRLTPAQYFQKNGNPLLVVNTTFFSFETDQNLNLVMKEGQLVSYNIINIPGKGKDSGYYHHTTGSAIGISGKRKADVAWLFTDSAYRYPIAFEKAPVYFKDKAPEAGKYFFAPFLRHAPTGKKRRGVVEKWKMKTAVGGGPVLIHNGEIRVTNNEEMKFAGSGLNDKHPRTAMGYTKDGKLIILVIQGRFPGIAEGADLLQEARMLKEIGCYEALNLDGGGSSCMLVNGKETIKPSDKGVQRPVPAVFIVR